MPTYGRNKVKDMVRSVLPSKRRSGARFAKQEMHQNSRRENRQNVSPMARDPELFEDYLDDAKWVKKQTRENVGMRREGDKIRPLMRWAPKVTHGLHDKRLAQLRALMPPNTIGEHAIGHVRYLEQFENPNDPMVLKYGRRSKRKYDKKRKPESLESQLRKMLEEEPWLHGHLNDWMKKHHHIQYKVVGREVVRSHGQVLMAHGTTPMMRDITVVVGPKHARTLKGMGDIKDFVADLDAASRYSRTVRYSSSMNRYLDDAGKFHPEWMEALKSFVAENHPPK